MITAAAWGEHYRAILADCSLPSLLSPRNLPALAAQHHVTFQIVTSRKDVRALWAHDNVARLQNVVEALDLVLLEDHGVRDLPGARGHDKYAVMTKAQNIAIASAMPFDAVVFNYADFVWADGSLVNAVKLLGNTAAAVLGFCLPIDETTGREALAHAGYLAPRGLAALALDHLHAEARYRFWDAPEFTRMPSYLLFPADDGITIKAYHQTALVVRPEALTGGIAKGTLDGDFTAELARRGHIVHADDSDRVMVVSLHDGPSHPGARGGNRTHEIEKFERRCSPEQVAFAQVPLHVRTAGGQYPGGADLQSAVHVLQP